MNCKRTLRRAGEESAQHVAPRRRFWCKARYPHGWIICCEDVCGGVFSVYRFSFALTLFFGFFALLTAWTSKFAARAHRGFWIAKVRAGMRVHSSSKQAHACR